MCLGSPKPVGELLGNDLALESAAPQLQNCPLEIKQSWKWEIGTCCCLMSACSSRPWCSSCLYAQIEMKRNRLVEGQRSMISQKIWKLVVLPEHNSLYSLLNFTVEQMLLSCCWVFVCEPSSALFGEHHNIQNLVSLKPGKLWSMGFPMKKK